MARPHYTQLATASQINYMLILFNDCGYDTLRQRLGFCEARGMDVESLGDLTKDQASLVIDELKDLRDGYIQR